MTTEEKHTELRRLYAIPPSQRDGEWYEQLRAVSPDSVTLLRQPRIYLSAAMRGVPEYNFPLIGKWARKFREAGVSVYSGLDTALRIGDDAPVHEHMGLDCMAICKPVKAVVVLDWGEPESLGVRAECALAESIGVPVVGLSDVDFSEQEIEQRFEKLVKGLKNA